jgi:hypothetical protein
LAGEVCVKSVSVWGSKFPMKPRAVQSPTSPLNSDHTKYCSPTFQFPGGSRISRTIHSVPSSLRPSAVNSMANVPCWAWSSLRWMNQSRRVSASARHGPRPFSKLSNTVSAAASGTLTPRTAVSNPMIAQRQNTRPDMVNSFRRLYV